MTCEPFPSEPTAAPTNLGGETQHCRRVLLSLVDMGHELAAMVLAQARSHQDNAAAVHDAIADYETATRSVRRSVMLHDKLGQPKKPRANRVAARKKIIREVEDAIEREAAADEQESLHAELLERLDRPEIEEEIATRPIGDIVTDITRDFGLAGLYDSHPWKRRIPHDIAILDARAEMLPGAAPSEKLLALLASAPPPPRPTTRRRSPADLEPFTAQDVAKMSDEEIAIRLERMTRCRKPGG